MKNSSKEIFLENVPELLKKASKESDYIPKDIADFCVYMSELADENLTPKQLCNLVSNALDDIINGIADFELCCEAHELMQHITYFPSVIKKFSDNDFSNSFDKLFSKTFGKTTELKEKNKDYGVLILAPNVVDISNKPKDEVLLNLYNNAHSRGLGFSNYDPRPMNKKEAQDLLKRFTYFGYLPGRSLQIDLTYDIIDTSAYNKNNGAGAAEKAISLCRNIK